MADAKLVYGTTEIPVDLLLDIDVSIVTESKSLHIPGGNPVVKPIATGGKTLTFTVLLYGNGYDDLRNKKKALEDFIEAHGKDVIQIQCLADPDYSGNYIISLDGQITGEKKNVAQYRIRAQKVY